MSAVERVEFISDRMSYIILRSCWFNIIVLNVRSQTEDKVHDMRDSFYEELEHEFNREYRLLGCYAMWLL
jgi:hypothetical protein